MAVKGEKHDYESIGLIPRTVRTEAGYRVYSGNDVATLGFIRCARDLGFAVEQIGELITLWRDRDRASTDVKRIALEHVDILERKARELQEMAATLRHLTKHCQGDERRECPIIEGLQGGHEVGLIDIHSSSKFGAVSLRSARRGTAPKRVRN